MWDGLIILALTCAIRARSVIFRFDPAGMAPIRNRFIVLVANNGVKSNIDNLDQGAVQLSAVRCSLRKLPVFRPVAPTSQG
jgi:hypothetical protein